MKDYQFVPHREWIGVGFTRLDPAKTDMALVYEWYAWAGWRELRKWCTLKRKRRLLDDG